MSTVQNSLWTPLPAETLDSKYEKCRNITEEIYKRINITFQIKKLETSVQSDLSDYSDQIDSNELSNETDLFACDKSSISSSTELETLEQGSAACEKFINNNNNEEKGKKAAISKRPKKRFRKRVKKQQPTTKESDGSSDDDHPLSRVAVVPAAKSLQSVLGVPNVVVTPIESDGSSNDDHPLSQVAVVPTAMLQQSIQRIPNIVITPIDLKKLNLPIPEVPPTKKSETKHISKVKGDSPKEKAIDKATDVKKGTDKKVELKSVDKQKTSPLKEKSPSEWNCTLCNMSFKGERGLRRHMTLSHILSPEDEKKASKARKDI